jgi:peptide deformylase
MILPVYLYGSPVLRKKAIAVDKNNTGLNAFIDDLWETMYNSDGVGLAAPQVGKSIRVFVVDSSAMESEDPIVKTFKKTFINAKIIESSGDESLFNEGCISIPNIREDVSRPPRIRIQYLDENWINHDEYFEGIPARIIQHEYDHLEGILFVDKIPSIRRKLLNGRLLAITKGKVDVAYKIKVPR